MDNTRKYLIVCQVVLLVAGTMGIIDIYGFGKATHAASLTTHGTYTSTPTPTMSTPTPTPENTCNDLLVLVNKTYELPASYVPPDLVSLAANHIPVTDQSFEGRAIEIPDLSRMIAGAASQGVSLVVLSPYRSFSYQGSVYEGYVKGDGTNIANQYSALPGHSQHQLGTAIDFSTNGSDASYGMNFGATKAGQWLLTHAYLYGFYLAYPQGAENITGYAYEPWHYRYIGVTNAMNVYKSGLILEQYLEKYGVIPHC